MIFSVSIIRVIFNAYSTLSGSVNRDLKIYDRDVHENFTSEYHFALIYQLFNISAANQYQGGTCIFSPHIFRLARKKSRFTEGSLSTSSR